MGSSGPRAGTVQVLTPDFGYVRDDVTNQLYAVSRHFVSQETWMQLQRGSRVRFRANSSGGVDELTLNAQAGQ
jgi:hypothetical protein